MVERTSQVTSVKNGGITIPGRSGAGGALVVRRTAQEIAAVKNTTARLPKPGSTSITSSGAGVEFTVDSAQLGKKLGKHVEDFGGSASNAADR